MKQLFNIFRLALFLAIRQILRTSRWATVLIVFIMMLTFLNLVATSGFLVGIVEGASRGYKEQWTGDLFINNRNEKEDIVSSQEFISALSSFPQIKSFTPRLVRGARIEANWWEKRKEEDVNVVSNQIAGVDPQKESDTTHIEEHIVEGTWLTEGDARGIVIGSAFLQDYSNVSDLVSLLKNIHPGTLVRVTVASSTQDFIVRGIVDSKVQFVSSRAYILDSELRKMAGISGTDVTEIAVVMHDGIDPYYVKAPFLENGFSKYAKINTAEEGAPEFLVNIKLFFNIIGTILGSVSVVVALITIFIIIYINALTRRRQIGIMKGIGVSEAAIEISYIYQALLYVLVGSCVALILIFAILKPYIDAHPIDTPFATIVLVAEAKSVFIKFILVVMVSMVAGFLPARIIVRKNTLDAILGRNQQ